MKGVHAMTHGHSALLAGLDQLRSASPGAVFGELIRAGLQELIEAEATAVIGAARYERSDGRTVQRNGHRPKQWLVVANGRRKPSARLRPDRGGSRRQGSEAAAATGRSGHGLASVDPVGAGSLCEDRLQRPPGLPGRDRPADRADRQSAG